MKSSNIIWGGALVLLGGLLLMDSLGIIQINFWQIIMPLLLILFGIWVLLGYFYGRQPLEAEEDSIPLAGIQNARIIFHHGAGQLRIKSGADPSTLASGRFGGGLKYSIKPGGEHTDITMRPRESGFPVIIPAISPLNHLYNWDVRLTHEIPLQMVLKTGASDTRLDLTNLQVTRLRLDSGVSSTTINLPENVDLTKVVVKAGVASVKLFVPEKVAAKIHVVGGLTGANVDRSRFPKSGAYYQSEDYESAMNKVDIRIESGISSIVIQ